MGATLSRITASRMAPHVVQKALLDSRTVFSFAMRALLHDRGQRV